MTRHPGNGFTTDIHCLVKPVFSAFEREAFPTSAEYQVVAHVDTQWDFRKCAGGDNSWCPVLSKITTRPGTGPLAAKTPP